MVSCDLASTNANLVDAIRDRLKDNKEGIDPMKITISAIHTHTGPAYTRTRRVKESGAAKTLLEKYLAGK